MHVLSAQCQPCSDIEVVLVICTSDLIIRGFIQDVTHVPEQQVLAVYLPVTRLRWKERRILQTAPEGSGPGWATSQCCWSVAYSQGMGIASPWACMCTWWGHSLCVPHGLVAFKGCIGTQRRGHRTLSRSIRSDLQVTRNCSPSNMPKFVVSVAQSLMEAAGWWHWRSLVL